MNSRKILWRAIMQNLSAAGLTLKRLVDASPNGNFCYRFFLNYYSNANSLGVPIGFKVDKENDLVFINLDNIEGKLAHILACGFLEPIFLKWLRRKQPSFSWKVVDELLSPVFFPKKRTNDKSVKDFITFTEYGAELLVDPTVLSEQQIINIGIKLSSVMETLFKTILAEGRIYVNELKDRVSALANFFEEPILIVVGNVVENK